MSDDSHQSKPVLITGGTGFIGSHLARKLVHQGSEVVLLDLYPNDQSVKDILDKVKIVKGDVADYQGLVDIINEHGIGSVVHTAAMLSVAAADELRSAYSVNIEGTFNLLEACRTQGVNRVVFVSSLAAFGPNTPFPFHDKSYREPANFYGVSKVCGEVLGTFYSLTHGMDFRCVRLAVVIGPGRRGQGATVSFSKFVEEVVLGKSGEILVPDYTILPIIHVDDVTNLLLALLESDRVSERILMSGGIPIPIQDFVTEVKKLIPEAEIDFKPDPVVEEVAGTWTLLTTMLVNQGQEAVYREIEDIDWKLEIDSVEKLAAKFVEEVRENSDIYSSY